MPGAVGCAHEVDAADRSPRSPIQFGVIASVPMRGFTDVRCTAEVPMVNTTAIALLAGLIRWPRRDRRFHRLVAHRGARRNGAGRRLGAGPEMRSRPTAQQQKAPAPSIAVVADERGRLRIDPSVVRKVAERAADLTPGVVPVTRKVTGISLGSTGVTAHVTITGQRVDLCVELALRYPGAVRCTADELRRRIADEVQRITSYQVNSTAVTVTALLPEPEPGAQ